MRVGFCCDAVLIVRIGTRQSVGRLGNCAAAAVHRAGRLRTVRIGRLDQILV